MDTATCWIGMLARYFDANSEMLSVAAYCINEYGQHTSLYRGRPYSRVLFGTMKLETWYIEIAYKAICTDCTRNAYEGGVKLKLQLNSLSKSEWCSMRLPLLYENLNFSESLSERDGTLSMIKRKPNSKIIMIDLYSYIRSLPSILKSLWRNSNIFGRPIFGPIKFDTFVPASKTNPGSHLWAPSLIIQIDRISQITYRFRSKYLKKPIASLTALLTRGK